MHDDQRILTTHVGSFPRPPDLEDLLIRRDEGEAVDPVRFDTVARAAMVAVVRRQVEAGIDVVNDGEMARSGFQIYVPRRMSGFSGESKRPVSWDREHFPDWLAIEARLFPRKGRAWNAPQCTGEVRYHGHDVARRELGLFASALQEAGAHPADRFITAASPGIVATTLIDAHYGSHEKYVFALARALREEYAIVIERGFLLQLDAPDLAMERSVMWKDRPLAEFLDAATLHVAALNEAIAGLPRERVRLHCCWGNSAGPHVTDVPLADVLPILYQARVGALSIEFANPRHQHEYAALAANPLPADMALVPGVIDSTTNFVEHPQVVANRILEAVRTVGDASRVIAGVDCGFGTFAGFSHVAPSVVWLKLAALAEGAAIASRTLRGRATA